MNLLTTSSSEEELVASLEVAAWNEFVDIFEFFVVDNVETNPDAINTDGYSFLTSTSVLGQSTTVVVDTGDDSDSTVNNTLETSTGVDYEWLVLTTGADGAIDNQITMLDNGLLNIVEYNEDGTAAETSTFYDLDDTEDWSTLQVDADGTVTETADFDFSLSEIDLLF